MGPNADPAAAGTPREHGGTTAIGASSTVIAEILSSAQNSLERIAREADAESEAIMGGVKGEKSEDLSRAGLCHACFSGDYPIPVAPHNPENGRQLRLVGV